MRFLASNWIYKAVKTALTSARGGERETSPILVPCTNFPDGNQTDGKSRNIQKPLLQLLLGAEPGGVKRNSCVSAVVLAAQSQAVLDATHWLECPQAFLRQLVARGGSRA